jgi:hypothetical protein
MESTVNETKLHVVLSVTNHGTTFLQIPPYLCRTYRGYYKKIITLLDPKCMLYPIDKRQIFLKCLEGTEHMGYRNVDGRIILKKNLKAYCIDVWTGFNWLRTGLTSGFSRTLYLTFGVHKGQDSS